MLQCGTTNKQLKIELLSQWKLESEFRNVIGFHGHNHKTVFMVIITKWALMMNTVNTPRQPEKNASSIILTQVRAKSAN